MAREWWSQDLKEAALLPELMFINLQNIVSPLKSLCKPLQVMLLVVANQWLEGAG